MAETLGSLCDKLTIVKLKQYHSHDQERLNILEAQEDHLQDEIDDFIVDALNDLIPVERLTFKSNKVFKKQGNEHDEIKGSIGEVFAKLAQVNCELWHEQEKVYDFEAVPPDQKNAVVKRLAILNLERNKCIDEIDSVFAKSIKERNHG
jgi:hypothetical protein